jgi:hypothetical protein
MIVPGSSNPLLLASGAGYQITNSLRFRASNSAYLTRTPASGGSQTTYTFSYWMKRGALGAQQTHFSVATNSQNYFALGFGFINNNNQLDFLYAESNVITARKQTSRVFRDPSAWYHVVAVLDTTNATAADRLRIYINGVRETSFSASTDPTQNTNQHGWNTAVANYIGVAKPTYALYHDGYLANVYFIDGQALTPASFGQTDATTGVWVPKAYSGTYGNNGFFLQFKDAASTTTIGYDTSGNSNNFTTSGISVTSGVTFDQMLDTPTNNYSTFDAISPVGSASSIGTLAAAHLTFDHSAANYAQRFGSFAVASGKWYFEYTITTLSSNKSCAFGIGKTADYPTGAGAAGSWTGCVGYGDFGDTYLRPISEASGVSNTSGVAATTFSVNDVIMIAFDVDAGKFWMGKNGTWFDSGNPSGGTNEKQTFTTGINWRPWCVQYGSSAAQSVANFGQRAFAYTPPTGFKALSTSNITSAAVSTSGTFTGNAAADGPFVWTNGNPAALTINGNAVTFGTHADKTAGGFKLRSSSSSYNASGSNSWTATAGKRFVQSKKPNNAQTN